MLRAKARYPIAPRQSGAAGGEADTNVKSSDDENARPGGETLFLIASQPPFCDWLSCLFQPRMRAMKVIDQCSRCPVRDAASAPLDIHEPRRAQFLDALRVGPVAGIVVNARSRSPVLRSPVDDRRRRQARTGPCRKGRPEGSSLVSSVDAPCPYSPSSTRLSLRPHIDRIILT